MKPAIFNTEMVRAILDGRKTQTRRVVNNVPKSFNFQRCGIDRTHGSKTFGKFVAIFDDGNFSEFIASPYKVGDIIYVREQMYVNGCLDLYYSADDELVEFESCDWDYKGEYVGKIPSIHMPKEYARLFLRVKDVRIELLNEISADDACKEGLDWKDYWCDNGQSINDQREWFKSLWESIYGNGSFDNRYVWVIEFERISKEEAING